MLLLFCTTIFGGEGASEAFKKMQALRAHHELEYAQAIGQLYLKIHPEDADVQLLMGLMALQEQDYTAAKQYLDKTLAIYPHYLDAQLGLIDLALIEKQPEQAQKILYQIDLNHAKNPRVLDAEKRILSLTNIQQPLPQPLVQKQQMPSKLASTSRPSPPTRTKKIALPNPLPMMRTLRQAGELHRSIQLGKQYLQTFPKDADVMLLMGLMYLQMHHLQLAGTYLSHALLIAPDYIDIKLGLIQLYLERKAMFQARELLRALQPWSNKRIQALQNAYDDLIKQQQLKDIDEAMKKRHFSRAARLTRQMLRANPNNIQLHEILAAIEFEQHAYYHAFSEYQWVLKHEPKNKRALMGVIDIQLTLHHERLALNQVNCALKIYPQDPDLLALRGRVYQSQHQLAYAASEYKRILTRWPQHRVARQQIKSIQDLNPHLPYGVNEVGGNTEVDYISDLKEIWQYTTAVYNRDFSWGAMSLNLNNTTRFGRTANQGLVHLFPVVNAYLSMRLTGAYANDPLLFPTYTLGGEGFYTRLPVEISGGYDTYRILSHISYERYTFSLSKEVRDYYFIFRPYFYHPNHGHNTILYTGTIYKYLGYKDTYLKLVLGSGTSPDLANLLTTNFLVINNNYVTLLAQFPVLNHQLLITVGGDYQHWIFHDSSRKRNISGGIIGLNYRFTS